MRMPQFKVTAAVVCVIALGLAGCWSRSKSPATIVNLDSCLASLTNVSLYAATPAGTLAMISTYDRTGGNRDWGNLDNIGRDGLVTIAELDGPGCVRRIWVTNINSKEICLFFDGEREPRIRVPLLGLFGKAYPFEKPLCEQLSGGAYCYVPFPYRKSLRIALTPPEKEAGEPRPYYHVNYETYPRGVDVQTYPRELSKDQREHLAAVQRDWTDQPSWVERGMPDMHREVVIEPGASVEWVRADGPGVVERLSLDLGIDPNLSAQRKALLLRGLVLRMYWDGSPAPSVEVPLGDFFCNGTAFRRFVSQPLAVTQNAFHSRFPMPFAKSASIEVRNDTASPAKLKLGSSVNSSDPPETPNYFHARWNQSYMSGVPYSVLEATGPGHFSGCYLTSLGMDGSWSILEGDESFRIDGESFPSIHGTGLEDYFNGGWYYSGLFERPLHGLTEKAAMRTSQYRFHLPDPIGFDESLAVAFEFGDGNRARGYMSSVAYWYQPSPHAAGTVLPPPAERFVRPDQVGVATIMCELFELERVGLLEEACERCLIHSARLGGIGVLQLRANAYREIIDGYESAKAKYEEFAASEDKKVARQARDLAWFHEAATNALLGIHNNAKSEVYLDGRLVGAASDVRELTVVRLGVLPGDHEIAVKATPVRRDGWVSVYLRTHTTNIVANADWEFMKSQPPNWPNTEGPGTEWKPVENHRGRLPKMGYWQFFPNAYVNMQSGFTLRPWNSWDSKLGINTAYCRLRFTVPAE